MNKYLGRAQKIGLVGKPEDFASFLPRPVEISGLFSKIMFSRETKKKYFFSPKEEASSVP